MRVSEGLFGRPSSVRIHSYLRPLGNSFTVRMARVLKQVTETTNELAKVLNQIL